MFGVVRLFIIRRLMVFFTAPLEYCGLEKCPHLCAVTIYVYSESLAAFFHNFQVRRIGQRMS